MDDTNSEILHEPTNDRMLIITHINTPIYPNGSEKWLLTHTHTHTHLSTESESAKVKNVIHM